MASRGMSPLDRDSRKGGRDPLPSLKGKEKEEYGLDADLDRMSTQRGASERRIDGTASSSQSRRSPEPRPTNLDRELRGRLAERRRSPPSGGAMIASRHRDRDSERGYGLGAELEGGRGDQASGKDPREGRGGYGLDAEVRGERAVDHSRERESGYGLEAEVGHQREPTRATTAPRAARTRAPPAPVSRDDDVLGVFLDCFQRTDANNDGFLDKHELFQALKDDPEVQDCLSVHPSRDGGRETEDSYGAFFEIFSEMDADSSSTVSWEEFQDYLHKHANRIRFRRPGRRQSDPYAEAQRAAAAGAGPQYTYNDETGQLLVGGGGGRGGAEGEGGRLRSVYVEDEADGTFRRVGGERGGRRFLAPFRNRGGGGGEAAELGGDPDLGGGSHFLKRAVVETQNVLVVAFLAAQGLLGGLALVNIFMTYVVNARDLPRGFLQYYSPIAVDITRAYYVLTTLGLLAATDKYSKDKLAGWALVGPGQRTWDLVLILLYLAAFAITVVNAPFEDLMHYSYRRMPGWHVLPLTSSFESKLDLWHILNFVRAVLCLAAWVITCRELRPRAFEESRRREVLTTYGLNPSYASESSSRRKGTDSVEATPRDTKGNTPRV